jgi:hypothetical protein
MIIPTLSHFDQSTACKFLRWGVCAGKLSCTTPQGEHRYFRSFGRHLFGFRSENRYDFRIFVGIWLWEGAKRTNWTSD